MDEWDLDELLDFPQQLPARNAADPSADAGNEDDALDASGARPSRVRSHALRRLLRNTELGLDQAALNMLELLALLKRHKIGHGSLMLLLGWGWTLSSLSGFRGFKWLDCSVAELMRWLVWPWTSGLMSKRRSATM